MDDSRNDDVDFSSDHFKNSIHKFLYQNGLTDIIKTQLRQGVISVLNTSSTVKSQYNLGECKQTASITKSYDVYDLALHSLVFDHFEKMGFRKVTCIFLPECGLNEKSLLSPEHALKIFGITTNHPVYDNIYNHGNNIDNNRSTLSCLLSWIYTIPQAIDLKERRRSVVGIQTDDEITKNLREFKARVELERQFKNIEMKYTTSFPNCIHLQNDDGIERKVQLIRSEYENKLKEQLAMEVEKFKEEELSKLKIEESLRTQKEIEKIRTDILSEYESRLRQEKEAMERKLRQGVFEQQLVELENHNTRKLLISDMDHMKRCESERLKSLEVQKHELDLEVHKARHQMRIAQELIKTAETKELETRQLISMEYDRAHVEATKNYLAATEAVRRQSEFYSKELSSLSRQRSLLTQTQIQPMDTTKDLSKPVMIRESAIQTEGHDVKDTSEPRYTNNDIVQDKGSAHEHEFKMLQLKLISEKKVHDESNMKLLQKLQDKRKQLNECIHFNEKLKTERDLALQEVDELRKLLSMSRRALACIQETPSISSKSYAPQLPQYLSQKFTERTIGTPHIESNKLLAAPYMNDGIQFNSTRHDNLELNYLYYKINDNQLDEYVTMKESKALLQRISTYPETVYVRDPVDSEAIQSSSVAILEKIDADTAVVLDQNEDTVYMKKPYATDERPKPEEDILDTDETYGSCEFDEESEI